MEVPWLFVHFSDAVSLSQSRRAAGFAPLPFAFAGALALARAHGRRAAGSRSSRGSCCSGSGPATSPTASATAGPAAATWFALVGGAAALVAGLALRPRAADASTTRSARRRSRCFVAARCSCTASAHWSPRNAVDPHALSPRLVHNLRTKVPKGAIVIAPLETSYQVAAAAPVYVVAAPVTHVANTRANDPYARARRRPALGR